MKRALPFVLLWSLFAGLATAQEEASRSVDFDFGGDLRFYPFFSTQDLPGRKDDTELLVLRLKLGTDFSERWSGEVHGVVQFSSPPNSSSALSVVSGGTRHYFDLESNFIGDGLDATGNPVDSVLGSVELDRLSLRYQRPSVRVVAGRQAVTWGVSYFWPVLDLFAPFSPARIDRDYKPGVDAVRVTIPRGDFSEIEVIVAGQGEDLSQDLSYASLGRLHVGSSDLGFMAGSFHEDSVAGFFFVGEALGSGVRVEAAYTDSGDPLDAVRERGSFFRATVGLDRQLALDWFLSAEAHWNGFGAGEPAGYFEVARSDRFERGEVASLARSYIGTSLAWQVHPLVALSAAVLINADDGSVLLQPSGVWSTSDNTSVQFGVIAGFGDDLENGMPRSEYGATPTTLWAAAKWFF